MVTFVRILNRTIMTDKKAKLIGGALFVVVFTFSCYQISKPTGNEGAAPQPAITREPDTRSDQEKIDSAAKMLDAAVAAAPVTAEREVARQFENEFSTLVHADPTMSELCVDLGEVRAAWIAAGVAKTAELWGETRDRACEFESSSGNVHLSAFNGSADQRKQAFYDEITNLGA
jgi:hypothetical protein